MARAGILYSQVAQAASQLLSEGKNPTIDTVRIALGGTGSKSTIAPMLKRWKADHQGGVAEVEIGLPAELIEAVKYVHERLQTGVMQQLDDASESHAQELAAMQAKLDTLLSEHDQLSTAHLELQKTYQESDAKLQACMQSLQNNALALTASRAENAGLQDRLADRSDEIAAMSEQLTQARAQFDHFQDATTRQRIEERQAFEQRIAHLVHELVSGRHRQEMQQSAIAQHETRYALLVEEQGQLRHTLSITQNELVAVRMERDQQATQIRDGLSVQADLEQRFDSTLKALLNARADAAAASNRSEMLVSQIAALEKKIEMMESEKTAWINKLVSDRQSKQLRDLEPEKSDEAETVSSRKDI